MFFIFVKKEKKNDILNNSNLRLPIDYVGAGQKSEDLAANHTIHPLIPGSVHLCAISAACSPAAISAH